MRFFRFIFFIVALLSFNAIKGQEICTHNIPYDSVATQFYPILGGRNMGMKLIKIYFHVYRNDSGGEGVNIVRLNQMINLLNNDFDGTNFSFYFNECEVRWVDDTDLMLSEEPCDFFFQGYEHGDGIDIHVKPDAHGLGDISGIASKIPGGELIIGGTAGGGGNVILALTNDLTHEVGHCLGLFHTHHGTCNESGTECDFTSFPGGNPTDGDYVDDTPPDPRLRGQWMNNCVWTGYKDCNYDEEYNPLTNNYMNYAPSSCKNAFTAGQISRMHALVWPEVVHNVAEGCCVAGENPPILTTSIIDVQCPNLGFDLSTLFNGILPINTVLIWSTDNNAQDGLNPVINPIINQNGTYYAYFYDEEANCYSAPAQVVITLPTGCCVFENDIYISENIKYSIPRVSAGNIFVQNGATLTIKSYIEFAQNKSIIVLSGGKLILEGSLLNKCQIATFWGGVKVENGGELLVRDATFVKAMDAVFAKAGSKIDIDYLTVFGLNRTTGTGLKLEQNVTVENIKRINIHDVHTAIEIRNGNSTNNLITIEEGEINNVFYAIGSVSRSLIIKNLTITNSDYGVLLYFCPGSIILNSTINSNNYGILAGWSPYLMVNDNQFSINQNPKSKNAINLFLSGNSSIVNNQNIEASELGINLWQSPFTTVSHNIINVFGDGNQYGGGVKLNGSSYCIIGENYFEIDHSSFGIETVSSSNSRIHNNQIDHFSSVSTRTAAIRSMGSSEEIIELNNAYGMGNTTGILAQNSSFNKYQCNVTIAGKEGLGIYYNSEIQNMQANIMDDATDLSIRSAVGTQIHHGNEFYGGKARADELSSQEIFISQFFVNSNISFFMPTDILPESEWFINESESEFSECDPQGGPSWTPFNGNNPTGICSYYTYLKSISEERPTQFKVKMIHLLKYLKKRKNVAFPSCIQTDSTYLTLCGLSSLVDVGVALDSLGDNHFTGNQIKDIQDQYIQDTISENRVSIVEDLQSEVEIWHEKILDKTDREKTILDSLQNEMNLVVCSDTLIQKWTEVYRIYMEYIKTDSITTDDKGVLTLLSRECSDLYGDVIHLARAMVNTYSMTYFDVFDGCGTELRYSRKRDQQDISVFPNPTEGKVYVRFQEAFDGVLDITDATGKVITQKKIKNSNTLEIDLFKKNGVYIFRFSNDEGNVINKKIVLIE